MSVSFQGPRSTSVDLTNVSASRILKAMGYLVSEETAGEMSLVEAFRGLEVAKGVLQGDDLILLDWLENILNEISNAGGLKLEWF